MAETGNGKLYAGLATGIVSISFAAVFVKLAEAPPSVVAALRMIFSSLILLPYVVMSADFRLEIRRIAKNEILLLILSSIFLSLHFLFWITSLSLTGVTSSIVFVAASPLFVAVYTVIIFRKKVSRPFWAGIAIAVIGGMVMGGGNLHGGGENWKGDLLAIAGAVSAAGYFLVGSRLRSRLSLITYVFPVYSFAALILALVVPFTGERLTSLSAKSYLYCFLMALVCQISGHTIFNWALKRVKATIVTFLILGEPVGTSILAFLILNEIPLPTEVVGGIIILGGILTVLYRKTDITE